jgi:hypothetical protein
MTDEFKDYVSALGKKCRDEIFHGRYRLTFKYKDEPAAEDEDPHATISLSIYVNPVYEYATIDVYPEAFEIYKAGEFERLGHQVLHELCHILTEPLWRIMKADMAPSQEQHFHETLETQTERIAVAICALLPKGWSNPAALGVANSL